MQRPPPSLIEQVVAPLEERWKAILGDPLLSIARLRERGIRTDLSVDHLRSLHWRIYLGQLPPPTAPTTSGALAHPPSWPIALEQTRGEWEALRGQFLRAPDGQLVDDGEGTGSEGLVGLGMTRGLSGSRQLGKPSTVVQDLVVNNPLSQDEANPWKDWFGDLELRKTIRQDVARTFPEIDYFRRPSVQDQMTNILHVVSKLNDDVGYRQGMHELLGPLLFAIDYDSLEDPLDEQPSSLMHQTLSRRHVEHDAYSLFSILFRAAKSDYDFNTTVPIPINSPSVPSRHAFGESPVMSSSLPSLGAGSAGTKLVQPIVEKCCRIFDNSLRRVDVELWQRLEELRIEPQIWGIRWVRLLFTREFSLDDALRIWDGLFAYDPSLRLVDFICVAMLLRAREALLDADYSTALQILLRYPAPMDGNQRLALLMRQAIFLQANPTADAGFEVRRQNRELEAEAGELSGTRASEESRYGRRAGSSRSGPNSRPASRHSVAVTPTSNAPNFADLGDLAKNALMERAEAFGLPKAFNSAFSDFKRTYGNVSGTSNGSSPTLFGGDVRAKQLAEDLTSIKASNEAMASALGTCVEVLEADFAGKSEAKGDETGRLLVLTALRHVQDVLGGKAPIFDARVMAPIRQRQRASTGTPSTSTANLAVPKPRKGSTSGSTNDSRRGSAASKTTFAMPAAPAPAHRQDDVRRGSAASIGAPTMPSSSTGSPALGSVPPTPPTKSPHMVFKPPSVPSSVHVHENANDAWSSASGGPARSRLKSSSGMEDGAEGKERKPLPDPLGVWTA